MEKQRGWIGEVCTLRRVFEIKDYYTRSIVRKIITDDTVTTQYIFDETTFEAEQRLKMKICNELRNKTNGEIKGHIWKEDVVKIKDMGWHSAKEFIRERLSHYKEIKKD